MSTVLRPMTSEDVPRAVELWNASYPDDQVSQRRFERVVFGDRHYEEAGVLTAERDDRPVGFVCCVAPEPGSTWLGHSAVLKGICAGTYGPGGVADELLSAAEGFARARGMDGLHVVEYAAGGYFFPGIPYAYEAQIAFFERNGYDRVGELHDVEVGLEDFAPTEWQAAAARRAAENGIEIVGYEPSMLGMLEELVAAIRMPQWFRDGWQEQYRSKRHTFVAVQGDRMLGYANYAPGDERGSFGTTAVLPDMRGQGIGSCLLVASMLKMKELGTPKVWAHWANTPFYLKNGWHICRRYATFHKDLGRAASS
jgi:GNAT superfamily N-acetyltransferase